MFMAALFIIAKKVETMSKCPSRDEWMNKTWYSPAMECRVLVTQSCLTLL